MTTDKTERKERPIASGVLDYFPDALAEVAHVSFVGNKQHNGNAPMHWDRSKSPDHTDCIVRHLMERGTRDDDGLRHSAKVAWRALAMLQIEIEKDAEIDVVESAYLDECDAAKNVHTLGTGVYLCGPMRGLPQLNHPAFYEAARIGRYHGFAIISPAEEDRNAGLNVEKESFSQAEVYEFARRDMNLIFNCGAVAVLPGWEKSTGATAEVALARWLGLPILDATTFKALEA